MIYLLIPFLLFSCNQNSTSANRKIDVLGFFDKNIKEEIRVSKHNINVKIYYKEEEILNTMIKVDSLQTESYKETMAILEENISIDSTNVFFKDGANTVFLKNDENLRSFFLKFDEKFQLSNNLNMAVLLKVNLEIENKNFNKALKIAEMSVYLRRLFYYGIFKDDRSLKIISQKELFNDGKQKEAINNLLKLN